MLRELHLQGTVTILNGTSVSSTAIYIPVANAIAAIQTPGAWTAADIGFQLSQDGGAVNFMDILDPNRVVSTTQLTVAPNFLRVNGIPTGAAGFGLTPLPFHEVGIGTLILLTSLNVISDARVAQAADRVLSVWVGRVD